MLLPLHDAVTRLQGPKHVRLLYRASCYALHDTPYPKQTSCSESASPIEVFVTKRAKSILGSAFLRICIICNGKILPNRMWFCGFPFRLLGILIANIINVKTTKKIFKEITKGTNRISNPGLLKKGKIMDGMIKPLHYVLSYTERATRDFIQRLATRRLGQPWA
jgi:hypothetical protein